MVTDSCGAGGASTLGHFQYDDSSLTVTVAEVQTCSALPLQFYTCDFVACMAAANKDWQAINKEGRKDWLQGGWTN